MKPNNINKTKSGIFPWDKLKSDTKSFFIKKMLKHFNDFQNRNFSVLWLKWTQTMEMKQNQTFFHETYSNLALFSLVIKYQHISITFIIGTSSKVKYQVKWNKITQDMWKSDCIFYLQSSTLLKWLLKFISW